MKKSALAAATVALALGFGASALADGMEPATGSSTTILRLGKSGDSGVSVKSEKGVAIYRGPAVKHEMLAGDSAQAPAARQVSIRKEVIIEHRYRSYVRHLRTQGFYSGHAGKSRRFTQGFYSGPIDLGGC